MTTANDTVAAGDLQAALDAAEAGATLRLAAGEHVGPFILERSVRLVGGAGVVLRGAGQGSLVVVQGRGVEVGLFGLSLVGGGDGNAGGGVSVPNGARLVLDDCTFEACVARGYGGGAVFLRRGEAALRGCRFVGCVGRAGGALLVSNDARLRAVDCVFTGCEALHSGAAVAVRDAAVVSLSGCDLRGCAAPDVGADAELGWLVDVQTRAGTEATALERCAGVERPGALASRAPRTLRVVAAG